MTVGPKLRIVMYDPGKFLPYYVDGLCRSLSALGLRARVIASPPLFEPVDPDGQYDVDEHFFPFLRGFGNAMLRRQQTIRKAVKATAYPAGVLRTWRALRRGPPGVLHLQWAPVPALDALVVRALKGRHWRVVYTVHDPLPAPTQGPAFRQHRRLLGLSDAVIVHTAQQSREIVSVVPEMAGRVNIIPHGGVRFPLPTAAERMRCREFLRVEPDRPLLLFFGLIKPYKGLEHLVAAMPNVIAQFPRALLLIAGEPLMSLRGLERQIDRLGLRDHVSLRPAFVSADEVPIYLRGADMLVAPYVSVGASGMVVLAQGHGLPVVATRVGGLPEFVECDECGFVVPARDPEALAEAICRGLSDPEMLAEMGLCGGVAWHARTVGLTSRSVPSRCISLLPHAPRAAHRNRSPP